ncbi:protoporphyrinogen oxidase [Paenibacillus sp. MBLB4367]|uniref:protoporphyrinogen oxidase n=1 Tax=Paenibacillus sp. MBLB4367 TaxID=3384767 RepID=UPI0039081039
MASVKQVVVVGGGISGLSSAFYVKKLFAEKRIPVNVTIVEKSGTIGGKIHTLRQDGFVIEKGPDSFLARKTPILDITRELGLEDELTATNPKGKQSYILHKGKLHPMPPGLVLGIPTEIGPFMKSGLISVAGKARAALDLLLPVRKGDADESLGDFIERRLGSEVLDHIAEPLLAGIYAGDTHRLSLQATFPQFQEAERKYGSLIKGMMANRKSAAAAAGLPEIAQKSVFLTYKNGLSTLVEALLDELNDVRIVSGQGVQAVVRNEEAAGGGDATGEGSDYSVVMENGEKLPADGVIAALPAYALSKLFPGVPGVEALGSIRYVSVANVIMAFNREDVRHPLNGSGFVIPRKEGRFITACTWTSSKWLHTAPQGKVLLRCYVGRTGEEERLLYADGELVDKVRKDIGELHGINAKPLFAEVTRLNDSMPQYPVGHLDTIAGVRKQVESQMPHVKLTGAAFRGVGIPDCVRQSKEAALELCRLFA